jgi:pimeloyl-ACP methyl ester carboxylesterase
MRTHLDLPIPLVPYAHRAQVCGDEIFFYAAGRSDAPPLLLLHGMADDADTWRHIFLPLSRFFRVIAPDLPGFGRSRSHGSAPTITVFARRLHALLRQLGIERSAVVGHSYGALIAQRLSHVAGVSITRRVLINGALPLEAGLPIGVPPLALLPGVGALAIRTQRRSPAAAFAGLAPFFADLNSLSADDRRFLERRVWARVQSAELSSRLLQSLRRLAVDTLWRAREFRLQTLTDRIPTMLIFGEKDRLIPPSTFNQLVTLRPDFQLHRLAECGHTPQIEQPELLSSLIVEHLAPRPMTLLRRRRHDTP